MRGLHPLLLLAVAIGIDLIVFTSSRYASAIGSAVPMVFGMLGILNALIRKKWKQDMPWVLIGFAILLAAGWFAPQWLDLSVGPHHSKVIVAIGVFYLLFAIAATIFKEVLKALSEKDKRTSERP